MVYLSGPMSGKADNNIPEFTRVAGILRARGVEVLCPHEIVQEAANKTWEDYVKADLIAMLQRCHSVARLKGWRQSRGAKIESYVADKLGYPIYDVIDDALVPANTAAIETRNTVIIERYLTGGGTMESVGTEFGLTKMRISQIVNGR